MSTNHNRIKVADLETNQPNKILKTNLNGELEFSDLNNLQAESYNALDCTTEGKTLDARQGKVLKDMIDNKNVNLSTDQETQLITAVTEDNKVVSRLKLFNWWQWIRSQTQTISGAWNFSNIVTLASGTQDTPPLVIPNGDLTTYPEDGAIERDSKGQLWEAHNGIRTKIVTENTAITLLNKSSDAGTDKSSDTSGSYEFVISDFSVGLIDNSLFAKINQSLDHIRYINSQIIPPSGLKIETYIKIVNGSFDGFVWGANPVGQYLLFDTLNLLEKPLNNRYTHNSSSTLRAWVTNNGAPGNACGIGIDDVFYNTRKLDNSESLLPADCHFQVVQKILWEYEDAENTKGLNQLIRVISRVNAFWLEKII